MWPFAKPAKRRPRKQPRVRGIYETGRPAGRGGVLGPDGTPYVGTLDSLPSWLASLTPPNQSIRQALTALRRASRVENARGGHLRSAVLAFRREVVGTGLQLRSLHPDRAVRSAVEQAWREWTADCDVACQCHWRQLCHSAVVSLVVDGEAIVRVRRGSRHTHGLALELVDAVRLNAEVNSDPAVGRRVIMGVELDDDNRPVAYWISRRAQFSYSADRFPTSPVPAGEILHVFDAADPPGGVRGIPWAFSSLRRFADIREYDDSERAAAKKGASVYAVYRPPEGVGLGDGSDEDDDDEGKPPAEKPIINVADGEIAELEPGAELDFHAPTHPNDRYDGFVSAQLRVVAASLGISYATLTGDLSKANFVSSRLGRLGERGTVQMMRDLLVERLAMPVYHRWLESAYIRGVVPQVGIDNLMRARFDGPAMEHVQPREAANADHQRLADGLVSRAELIRATGRDPEEVFDEIEAEKGGGDGGDESSDAEDADGGEGANAALPRPHGQGGKSAALRLHAMNG